MSPLYLLTAVLGHPAEDARRALRRAGGNVDRAANILLEGGLRNRAALPKTFDTLERAGPSRGLLTPPSTASPETVLIESSEDETEYDNEGDDLYAPPTPIPTASVSDNDCTNNQEFESAINHEHEHEHSPTAHGSTFTGDEFEGVLGFCGANAIAWDMSSTSMGRMCFPSLLV